MAVATGLLTDTSKECRTHAPKNNQTIQSSKDKNSEKASMALTKLPQTGFAKHGN
jgi:hypothetical protein